MLLAGSNDYKEQNFNFRIKVRGVGCAVWARMRDQVQYLLANPIQMWRPNFVSNSVWNTGPTKNTNRIVNFSFKLNCGVQPTDQENSLRLQTE